MFPESTGFNATLGISKDFPCLSAQLSSDVTTRKKMSRRKISSESVNFSKKISEKPWFSQFELALFELFDFEFYLMKSVNRNLQFAVFLVFPKNGPLRRLLGRCLCYDQLFFYISATLCAIFMNLAPKMWRPQWFEVG